MLRVCCILFHCLPLNWFSFIALPESISYFTLISELNAFWRIEYKVCNWGERKGVPVWISDLFCQGRKIKPFRLLEQIQDFCEIHPTVIQGYSTLYWTHPCVWVSMYVCVAPYCWLVTVMGGSSTVCGHFSLPLTFHSKRGINSQSHENVLKVFSLQLF